MVNFLVLLLSAVLMGISIRMTIDGAPFKETMPFDIFAFVLLNNAQLREIAAKLKESRGD